MGKPEPPPAAVTYAQQLVGRGHGLPLWFPDKSQANIGDVGFVVNGCFYRMFNAMRPHDDPTNVHGVPENFIPLRLSDNVIYSNEQYLLPGPICAESTPVRNVNVGIGVSAIGQQAHADASYSFDYYGTQGAIAILGDVGKQEHVLLSLAFREYMLKNHDSWHKFARSLDFDVRHEDIIFVSGWVKTSEWASAAFSNEKREHDLTISASIGSACGAHFEVSHKEKTSTNILVEQRSNLAPSSSKTSISSAESYDQCLFLKYHKIKYSKTLGRRLRGEAKAKDVTCGPEGYRDWSPPLWMKKLFRRQRGTAVSNGLQPAADREHVRAVAPKREATNPAPAPHSHPLEKPEERESDESEAKEPLDELLDYMLEASDADVAVADFEDLYTMCPPSAWPEHIATFLRQRRPKIVVDKYREGPKSRSTSSLTAFLRSILPEDSSLGRMFSAVGERAVAFISPSTPQSHQQTMQKEGEHLYAFPKLTRSRTSGSEEAVGARSSEATPRRRATTYQCDTQVDVGTYTPVDPFDSPTCAERYGLQFPSRFDPSRNPHLAVNAWEPPRGFLSPHTVCVTPVDSPLQASAYTARIGA